MVKIAYLVLAHKNPGLLKRAIGALSSKDCAFFIHIDQKTDIGGFAEVRGENVFLSERRIPVYWSEFSQILATTGLLQPAVAQIAKYDYFVLLQGSDYPLRSSAYIHDFLTKNRGLEFISMVRMPVPGKPISRISTLTFPSEKPVRRLATRALAKLGLAQRDYRRQLRGLEPYSGDACWALSRDACEYILRFMEVNRHVQKYFENTFVPEESFFHTILGNSSFKSRVRRNLLYSDWSAGGAHPAMISAEHAALFEAQDRVWLGGMYGCGEALFARKFSDSRLDLVDRIDEMIRRKEGPGAVLPTAAGR